MKYNIPKYYRYVILFKEEMEDVEPIIKVPNLSELRSINKGRLHLFDEELLSILPAIEYCLHMPRTELDTYDTDTEILDKEYDVSHKQLFYGAQCKIAFAECVLNDEQNQGIRACSDAIVNVLKGLSKENKKLQVSYGETLTISDLKKFIAANMDADILHISGHGYYDRRSNMAGLMVGNEFWMADGNDYTVPPVVVLSACHVSPRGSGTVNVADMFIRAGAEAVLGTFIPIDAKRNTVLISRLYTYIAEAQKGSGQYKTLSEAWSGVVATNAIHEMAETSKKFSEWIWGINSKGKRRMIDFTMERSVGRLHGSTMYADTILIVKEMLHEEGLDGKFDDVLNQENYFPESFFYQWVGVPENIFCIMKCLQKQWIYRKRMTC